MRMRTVFGVVFLACAVTGGAQEKGTWRAASTTARGITGDVTFSGTKIVINFSGFTIAQIRELTPAETAAVFGGESQGGGDGNLYRLSIPATKMFLHHNTMCGAEETQWMVTAVAGKELQLAFFSGAQMPVFTSEAVSNSTALCGTYSYVR